jgi:hypothetical protein
VVNHNGFAHAPGTHENHGPACLLFLDQRKEQFEIGTPFHFSKNSADGVIALPPRIFRLDSLNDFRRRNFLHILKIDSFENNVNALTLQ